MSTTTLRAFHGDPKIKRKYLDRLRSHAKADEIVQGYYWENGKGCAVGCTIHGSQRSSYETELGVPSWLARLEDGIFERLKNGEAKTFPVEFLTAIHVGSDVSGVRDQFLAWLMDDPTHGLATTAKDNTCKALAKEVAERLRKQEGVTGKEADELTERLRAAWAARDAQAAWAARDARDAWDARDAQAAWAARDARDARDAWDARDAQAAWAARAARAARAAFVSASAKELIRLLKATKP